MKGSLVFQAFQTWRAIGERWRGASEEDEGIRLRLARLYRRAEQRYWRRKVRLIAAIKAAKKARAE